ncbi:hypothetical protein [Dokdonella fugitiva]|jgi:hypothetical protein|uniref:Uncharacterized protein n=1 Tax=Dokdonella fugitiva TaxID=328517 RepID=A0A4R2IBD3_9GAMM|nr:hypothetical protein [Dokdonella fugitiva]MBA8883684.1 hypothetical protein [Dokdonella fugitiva]TCO41426.1 hypothetical protein EV148_103346 [Dokdonella fugitiva]
MNALSPSLQSLFSIIIPALVLAALVLLWRRDRSAWLVVALGAEAVGLLFRFALTLMPDLLHSAPLMLSAWTLSALVFAVGLLGYAIEVNGKR